MRTELRLFGKHYNMATQSQRKRLVASFYMFFLILIALSWFASPSGYGASFVTVEFTIFAGPILGGYLTGWMNPFSKISMVKPFGGNQLLKYRSGVEANEIRNDERELNRRNYAHYIAYRILGALFAVAFLVDFLNSSSLQASLASAGISPLTLHRLVQVSLQAGYVLFLTLPAAILLWTEPDMENQQ